MLDDLEDDSFEKLLADKQHKQLLKSVDTIAELIRNDDKTEQVIIRYNQDLSVLLGKIEQVLSKPDIEVKPPLVTVVNQNKEINNSIVLLQEEIKKVTAGQGKIIELLSIKPVKLKPVKNYAGQIEYVDIEWESLT